TAESPPPPAAPPPGASPSPPASVTRTAGRRYHRARRAVAGTKALLDGRQSRITKQENVASHPPHRLPRRRRRHAHAGREPALHPPPVPHLHRLARLGRTLPARPPGARDAPAACR